MADSVSTPARWPAAMTKPQAAEYLAIGLRSLERRISSGDLQMIRIGGGCYRLRRSDLDEYLDQLPFERGERPGV